MARLPEIVGVQAKRRDVADFPLPRIAGGKAPEGIGEVVVDTTAAGGEEVEQVGEQEPREESIVAGETEKARFCQRWICSPVSCR